MYFVTNVFLFDRMLCCKPVCTWVEFVRDLAAVYPCSPSVRGLTPAVVVQTRAKITRELSGHMKLNMSTLNLIINVFSHEML